jgi:signal transduction histidine kinase
VSIIGSGMFVRSQRMLMLNLRDQAHQAESEARLLAEQAQRLAREALQDLREIIGVLRAGESDDAAGGRPQPTLAALDVLVAECREASP